MDQPTKRYKRRDYSAGVVIGGLLLYLPERERYAFLNEEAAEIWDAMQEPITAPDLANVLHSAEFVSEPSTAVDRFLTAALEFGLVDAI